MKIDVLTLFPEMFAPLAASMVGRACEQGLLAIDYHDIRDYSLDKHKKTDDYPFGGGAGMVMSCDPIFRCLEDIDAKEKRILYMSPKGKIMDQAFLEGLAQEEEVVILCGHYEGIDQRVLDAWQPEEVSIGDYILTGGEPAAIVLIDATARLIPGVLSSEEAAVEESVYSGLLEYPQYTKPRAYRDMEVPEVLLSGHHENIHLWQFEQALRLTRERRPDLLDKYLAEHGPFTKKEQAVIEKVLGEKWAI